MQVVSLLSLIEEANGNEEEDEIEGYLSSFSCQKNKDVESFLRNKALDNEKRSMTRTSLVIDEENNNEIIGYFTLLVKPFEFVEDVSKGSRKILSNNKNSTVFNSILIAQLGRSDRYKGKVEGKTILEFALENCLLVNEIVGLRVVCIEYDDIPYLNDFYLVNDFRILQVNNNGKLLAYIKL
ncbi:MAG TPA: hypothetical protein GXX18_12140 [Bacillales bacterium]|nr:hypothetical protein [Bacillales bacterium]